jgi:hypothetical protein
MAGPALAQKSTMCSINVLLCSVICVLGQVGEISERERARERTGVPGDCSQSDLGRKLYRKCKMNDWQNPN